MSRRFTLTLESEGRTAGVDMEVPLDVSDDLFANAYAVPAVHAALHHMRVEPVTLHLHNSPDGPILSGYPDGKTRKATA